MSSPRINGSPAPLPANRGCQTTRLHSECQAPGGKSRYPTDLKIDLASVCAEGLPLLRRQPAVRRGRTSNDQWQGIPVYRLYSADLLIDAIYQGGRKGNAGDDPFP